MRKPYLLISLFVLALAGQLNAQPPKRMTATEYIAKFKGEAIEDMMKTGVPASITLAQGILESDAGNSNLAREANNHFGIKCHKEWSGETYIMDDDEKDECFRKYPSVLDSYDDHGLFLRSRPRYASLFDLDITDYKAWAHGLKKAGYATNPRYAELLIKIIEEHDLNQYDKGGVRMPVVPTDGKTSPNQPINKKPEEPKHQASEKPAPKPQKGTAYNGVPYVRAKKGDTWYSLAVENEMRLWQVLKYNDAEKNDLLKEGEIVYLKPKRGRPESEFHQVVAGETLREIAQEHGVKLDHLIRLNGLENDIKVQPGQQIRLRR